MGVLNCTPDSFSDGGKYNQIDAAISHALDMIQQGADIIDIGGESSRPGATPVSEAEELQRTIPIITALRSQHPTIPISIDTTKPKIMQQAVAAGATMINDINALTDKNALSTAAELQVPVCLMHKVGTPQTMQINPQYTDIIHEVTDFLKQRIEAALVAGIKQIIIDPGFGFGKSVEHNCTLFQNLPHICQLGYPVLIGVSRKSMLGAITHKKDPQQRTLSSTCAAMLAVAKGCRIVRVHDVAQTRQALDILNALL